MSIDTAKHVIGGWLTNTIMLCKEIMSCVVLCDTRRPNWGIPIIAGAHANFLASFWIIPRLVIENFWKIFDDWEIKLETWVPVPTQSK